MGRLADGQDMRISRDIKTLWKPTIVGIFWVFLMGYVINNLNFLVMYLMWFMLRNIQLQEANISRIPTVHQKGKRPIWLPMEHRQNRGMRHNCDRLLLKLVPIICDYNLQYINLCSWLDWSRTRGYDVINFGLTLHKACWKPCSWLMVHATGDVRQQSSSDFLPAKVTVFFNKTGDGCRD